MGLETIIKTLLDAGVNITLMTFLFYFGYRFLDGQTVFNKMVRSGKKEVEKMEQEEILKSEKQVKAIQKYLRDNKEEAFNQGIDRCNIFLNHNGLKNGENFHFLYFSIIAGIQKAGLSQLNVDNLELSRLPYYTFVAYIDKLNENGEWFTEDCSKEYGAIKAIGKELGTKSLYIKALYNIDGILIGLIFNSSVFEKISKQPNMEKIFSDIRAILI